MTTASQLRDLVSDMQVRSTAAKRRLDTCCAAAVDRHDLLAVIHEWRTRATAWSRRLSAILEEAKHTQERVSK
jgi:hypothetical protein